MNKEIRRKDRAVAENAQVLHILDQAKVLHLGLYDHAFPYVVPLHYGYEQTEDGKFVFYMHCATIGHKLDLIRQDPHVCIELETDVKLLSGGEIPCEYGSAYASFIGQGVATIVKDTAEKMCALNCIMEHQTGRRFLFTEQMTTSVAVIRVDILEYTAKARR